MSKRTIAQTPAPKKDRIKGSRKNPKGSASGKRGSIEIGADTEKALVNARDKHNKRYRGAGKTVDLGTLKAVFRRGAGAFSTSHRPGMNRNQWGLARVKAFLKLVGTGERKEAYNTDLDLLPKAHPQYRADKETLLAVPKKYDHIDFVPPKGAQDAAERALRIRASKPMSQRGMTAIGIARARDLKAGKALSPETVRRMLAYFTRHEVDKEGATWKDYGKGRQAWLGWGGDAGYRWAQKVVNQMNDADKKQQALRAYGEAVLLGEVGEYKVPDGLTVGKPFKTLGLGQVSSRMNGEKIGNAITSDLLEEMRRVYYARREADPVIIDWQHATSPFNGGPPAPPESGNALGLIVDLELREDGLYAIPAYNERGLSIVRDAGGVLWSSPEYLDGEVYAREGGEKIGDAQLLAITLTPRPAQASTQLEPVTLGEKFMEDINEMSIDELRDMLRAKHDMVLELEKRVAEMTKKAEAAVEAQLDTEKEEMGEYKIEVEEMEEKKEDEPKKMAESVAHSENLQLLNEVKALREQLLKVEAEKYETAKSAAINTLLSEGKIAPSAESAARDAYDLRDTKPALWAHFSEAAPVVPMKEIGHGASAEEITRENLAARLAEEAKTKNISFSEALHQFRSTNPDQYARIYGG
jgi:hypothetical protein